MAIWVKIKLCLPSDHKGEMGDFSPKRNSLYCSLRYLIILLCIRVYYTVKTHQTWSSYIYQQKTAQVKLLKILWISKVRIQHAPLVFNFIWWCRIICFQALIFAYLSLLYLGRGFCLYFIIMQLRVAVECISGSFVRISISLDRQSPAYFDSRHAFEINTWLEFGNPGAKSSGGVNHHNSFDFHEIKLIFTSWESRLCFGFLFD